ncbi:hypothetical protein [Pseudomonas sp. On1]|jgi:uncharacterized membrane protein|uniref:hypothetical protein n=1 Tax=Pseudomonas sp. On1 TaxID=3083258 RepID=UPI00234FDC0E|nr:hypothetical protein [Pseudomonas sp. On1]MDX2309828.1 hypothetical protein [Pseudomonas sp. On1]HBO7965349.1 hypothetical protein [Pseudomonas aeruginosa]
METQPFNRSTPKSADDYRKERNIKNVVLVIVIAMISFGVILNLLAWSDIGRPYTTEAGIWIGSLGIGIGWFAGKVLN